MVELMGSEIRIKRFSFYMIDPPLIWKTQKCSHCGIEFEYCGFYNTCPKCYENHFLMERIRRNGERAKEERRKEKLLVDQIVERMKLEVPKATNFSEFDLLKSFIKFLDLIHFNRLNSHRSDWEKIRFDIYDLYRTTLDFLGEEAKNQWTEDDVIESIFRVLKKMK